MRNIRWIVPFETITGKACEIRIYDEGFTGSVQQLTAAPMPIVTQEDSAEDITVPRRGSTGHISLIEQTPGELSALLPTSSNLERYVELVARSEASSILWRGYIKAESLSQNWDIAPREVQYSIVSPLAVMENVFLAPADGGGMRLLTLAEMLLEAVEATGISYTTYYLPKEIKGTQNAVLSGDVDYLTPLRLKLSRYTFFSEKSNIAEGESAYDNTTAKDVIEAICTFFGWTATERGASLYFVSPLADTYLACPSSVIEALSDANYTAPSLTEVTAPTHGIASLELDGNDHAESLYQGAKIVTVEPSAKLVEDTLSLPDSEDFVRLPYNAPSSMDMSSYLYPLQPSAATKRLYMYPYNPTTQTYQGATIDILKCSMPKPSTETIYPLCGAGCFLIKGSWRGICTDPLEGAPARVVYIPFPLDYSDWMLAKVFSPAPPMLDALDGGEKYIIMLDSRGETFFTTTRLGKSLGHVATLMGDGKPLPDLHFTETIDGCFRFKVSLSHVFNEAGLTRLWRGLGESSISFSLQIGNKYWAGGKMWSDAKVIISKNLQTSSDNTSSFLSDTAEADDGMTIEMEDCTTYGRIRLIVYAISYPVAKLSTQAAESNVPVVFKDFSLEWETTCGVNKLSTPATYFAQIDGGQADSKEVKTNIMSYQGTTHAYNLLYWMQDVHQPSVYSERLPQPLTALSYATGTAESPEQHLLSSLKTLCGKPYKLLSITALDHEGITPISRILCEGSNYRLTSVERNYIDDRSTYNLFYTDGID